MNFEPEMLLISEKTCDTTDRYFQHTGCFSLGMLTILFLSFTKYQQKEQDCLGRYYILFFARFIYKLQALVGVSLP